MYEKAEEIPKIMRYVNMRTFGLPVKSVVWNSGKDFLNRSRDMLNRHGSVMLRVATKYDSLNLPKVLDINKWEDFLESYKSLRRRYPNDVIMCEEFYSGDDSINLNFINRYDPEVEIMNGVPQPNMVSGEVTPLSLTYRGFWNVNNHDVPKDFLVSIQDGKNSEWLDRFGLDMGTLFWGLSMIYPYVKGEKKELIDMMTNGREVCFETVLYRPNGKLLFFDYTDCNGRYVVNR